MLRTNRGKGRAKRFLRAAFVTASYGTAIYGQLD